MYRYTMQENTLIIEAYFIIIIRDKSYLEF
jgi:hypothetical protein